MDLPRRESELDQPAAQLRRFTASRSLTLEVLLVPAPELVRVRIATAGSIGALSFASLLRVSVAVRLGAAPSTLGRPLGMPLPVARLILTHLLGMLLPELAVTRPLLLTVLGIPTSTLLPPRLSRSLTSPLPAGRQTVEFTVSLKVVGAPSSPLRGNVLFVRLAPTPARRTLAGSGVIGSVVGAQEFSPPSGTSPNTYSISASR